MKTVNVLAMVVALINAANAAERSPERIYPEGARFPLLLYSIHTVDEMHEVQTAGWNVAHRYNFAADFLETATAAGWMSVAHLEGKTTSPLSSPKVTTATAPDGQAANREEAGDTGEQVRGKDRLRSEAEVSADIRRYAAYDCLAWWDLPEEQRWWRQDEYTIVKTLSAWTRKYDPKQRPNYMYLPGHYQAEAVAKYVPYLDIIGTGTYTEYTHQPRAWVRWRTEETIRGIKAAGYAIGADYLNGEKTPIGIPMLFSAGLHKMDAITPVEAYHDFWSCIASGARGIFLFSYWHKRDLPILRKTWEDGYNRAARNLTTHPGLARALLFGTDVPLEVTVTKGSPRTSTFRPYGLKEDISLPAVNVLGKAHEGILYIITVSSGERPVTARISGLPTGIDSLEVLCENRAAEKGGDSVPVTEGNAEDTFPWLTVHLYRARLPR